MKKKISIVVPCYNEEESLPIFYEEIKKIEKEMSYVDFEYVFVNDGSRDKTLEIFRKLAKKDKKVRYVSFSRNFGKEAGMLAGLEYSTGDFVTVMDADLQDPPKMLIEMYEGIKEGYDCVGLRRATRKGEPKLRSFFAKCYYKLINKISDVKVVDGARDFRLMTRQMVNSILELKEHNRYSKGIFSWVGYKVKYIEYENVERVAGNTKWSFWSLFKYSIESIVGYSTVPLVLSTIFGIIAALISIVLFILFLINKSTILGIITLILFLNSCNFIFIGILGIYISKMHIELHNRPLYIIKEHNVK